MILRMSAVIKVMWQMFAWEDCLIETHVGDIGNDSGISSCDDESETGNGIDGEESASGSSIGVEKGVLDNGNAGGDMIDGDERGSSSSSGGDGDRIAGGNDSEDEATLISKLAEEIAYNLVNVSFNQLCKYKLFLFFLVLRILNKERVAFTKLGVKQRLASKNYMKVRSIRMFY